MSDTERLALSVELQALVALEATYRGFRNSACCYSAHGIKYTDDEIAEGERLAAGWQVKIDDVHSRIENIRVELSA